MAKSKAKSEKAKTDKKAPKPGLVRRVSRRAVLWLGRGLGVVTIILVLWIMAYRFINPPITPYIWSERARLEDVRQDWVRIEDIAPIVPRSVVAAEDANFCLHWGFDMAAIRAAIDAGAQRGASTLTQQTVKNAFLWHGRSWFRKALEALMTPAVEILWPKERILEVYLNIAEFDEGVFGVGAAGPWYFGTEADQLSPSQAAALAAVLPNPKARSAIRPTPFLQRRAARIRDGAETIRRDGRADCFED